MKRYTMHMMIAAAALTAAAATASAQTMKAEIPFTFRAGTGVMNPGTYDVKISQGGSRAYLIFHNRDDNKSVLVAQYTMADAPKGVSEDKAILRFECAGAQCVLRNVWPGFDSASYEIPGPKLRRDDTVKVAMIPLTRTKAD